MLNSSNGLVAGSSAYYFPFGAYRAAPTQTITDRQFTGHAHNDDLGLIYMNARYYVGSIGRFASADIVVPDSKDPQAWNRYSYVRNNPLILIDPSGHCWGFASGLRDGFFGTTCNNIDTAWSIVTNPNTTPAQRLPAAAYVGGGAVAVGTVVAGTTVAATGCLTGVGSAACAYAGSAIASANATAAAHPVATAVVGGALETAFECTVPGAACTPSDLLVGAATVGLSTPSIRGAAPGTGSAGGPTAGRAVTPNQRQAALQANSAGNANGHYSCTHCGYQNTNASHFDIDHIVPRSQGGNTTTSNLRVLCQGCNRSAQAGWPPRQGAQWANQYPERDLRNQVD